MKKTLLTTTAIFAALASGQAQASNLQVNVGGFIDFQAGYGSDDIVGAGADVRNDVEFNTDSEIHFVVEGVADNGLEYGAVIELETDVNGQDSFDAGAGNADKAYVYLQGGWGRVELGENTDAAEALSVNTSNFASATGGVDGDWYRYVGLPATSGARGFIIKPDLYLAHSGNATFAFTGGDAADEDATKITYYTPRFSGFQLGVSYIPNSGDTGRANFTNQAVAATDNEDVWALGVNYSGQWDDIGIAAAVTGIKGSDKTASGTADHEGYDAGLNLSFGGITVGGSYGDWEDSLGGTNDAMYWDLGIGYAAGPWSVSATYIDSEVDRPAGVKDEFSNIVIGADYQLAPGLVPYAEVAVFDLDGNGTGIANDNEGTVFILGTELTF